MQYCVYSQVQKGICITGFHIGFFEKGGGGGGNHLTPPTYQETVPITNALTARISTPLLKKF